MSEIRKRRRGAALEQAILEAAWTEVTEHGWDAFAIAGVAERCGTSKHVIYRRWGNRVELAQEMLVRALEGEEHTLESTGSLRGDLLRFLEHLRVFYAGPFGRVVRGVIKEREDRTSSLTGPVVPAPVTAIFEAAVERGELDALPSPMLQNVGHTMMTMELMWTEQPIDAIGVEGLVDELWLPALLRTRNDR